MWDNLADILEKLAAKKPVKSWLLCVAMENLRMKNSSILRKSGCLHQELQKLESYNIIFPLQ